MIDKNYLSKKIVDLEFKIEDALDTQNYADAFAFSSQKRCLQDLLIDA